MARVVGELEGWSRGYIISYFTIYLYEVLKNEEVKRITACSSHDIDSKRLDEFD